MVLVPLQIGVVFNERSHHQQIHAAVLVPLQIGVVFNLKEENVTVIRVLVPL